MGKHEKLITKILRGTSDKNISFDDLTGLMLWLDFNERIKGSHHIYTRDDVEEIINLQPNNESKAKPYQVKQVREIIIKYKLADEPEDESDN
jgi:hypothetical protein